MTGAPHCNRTATECQKAQWLHTDTLRCVHDENASLQVKSNIGSENSADTPSVSIDIHTISLHSKISELSYWYLTTHTKSSLTAKKASSVLLLTHDPSLSLTCKTWKHNLYQSTLSGRYTAPFIRNLHHDLRLRTPHDRVPCINGENEVNR